MSKYFILTVLLFLFSTTGIVYGESDPFSGKLISKIKIIITDIFEKKVDSYFYEDLANSAKVNTKAYVIRQELLFKQGDNYDAFKISESIRSLRNLKFLRKIEILTEETETDCLTVTVYAQDTWTLIPQVKYSSGVGKSTKSAGLSESNFLGYGKRVELLYEQDESQDVLESVVEDPRIYGTSTKLLAAYFDREDGQASSLSLGSPFRSLVDKYSWNSSFESSDSLEKLYSNASERFLFRKKESSFGLSVTKAFGDPSVSINRVSFGVSYQEDKFSQATIDDYNILDLDPQVVSNELEMLASDRRYVGPSIGYSYIIPDYISLNYIDRFDRVEDFNLGTTLQSEVKISPEALGSMGNSLLFNLDLSKGFRFSSSAFSLYSFSVDSRLSRGELRNSKVAFQARAFKVYGSQFFRNYFLGKHTLVGAFQLDYGSKLDKDFEYLLGGNNGIRGYQARSFTGSNRYILNLEDRIHMFEDVFDLFSVGSAFFLDLGGASDSSLADLFQNNSYSNVGFGLRLAFPRSSGSKVLRLDLSFPFRDGQDGSSQLELRLVIAGGQLFGSRPTNLRGQPDTSISMPFNSF